MELTHTELSINNYIKMISRIFIKLGYYRIVLGILSIRYYDISIQFGSN
jgi:hypothetical protein